MRRAVEHRIGHALQPFQLLARGIHAQRAVARRPAECRQPVPQRAHIAIGGVGAMDDRVGPLAKLRHQRRDLRHAEAQLVDMGADTPAPHDIRLDAPDQRPRIAIQLAQLVPDRGGGFPRLPRQPPDFVRNHRKALRRRPAARRLDRGVDAQQPRLPRDRPQLLANVAYRLDHGQELAQMPFQPGDMLDQACHLAQRQADHIMPVRDDPPGAPRGQAQFLRSGDTLILARRQRRHIGLQIGQMRRIPLNAKIELAQISSRFAALQCDVA